MDRNGFYMSNQNYYILLNIRTTLSTGFKTEKSCKRSVNYHFIIGVMCFLRVAVYNVTLYSCT